jgi:hypothetical protein
MFVNFEKIRDYDCSLANKIVTVATFLKGGVDSVTIVPSSLLPK